MNAPLNEQFLTLQEIYQTARRNLAPGPWAYLMGGAETETTVLRNRMALDQLAFRPRVLRDVSKLDSDPFACRALHYDAVYNGHELGSGSIRITDPAIQRTVFRHLGLSPADIDARFGFLLTALGAGAPPHGGFAVGFDRTAMLLAGAGSLRDVIAFPKTTAARALFEGAPAPARPEDLAALHIKVVP